MTNPRPTINIAALVPHTPYADISNAQPSIQGVPERDWVDADLNLIKMWHNVQLNDAEILTLGAMWHGQIMAENEISTQTAILGLRLAMSLKSMDPSKVGPLLSLPTRAAAANGDVPAAVNLPELRSFGNTPFTIRAQQVVAAPTTPVLPSATVVAAGAPVTQPEAPTVPAGTDTESEKRFAYTFLSAYLIKLLIKSPENVVRGIDNMRTRYESFYGPSRIITGFVFSQQKAFAYKEALLSQANILTTYTAALAYTQVNHTAEQNVKETGVLSYLGYLPFSYTGLHAYTMIIELKNLTNAPLDKLLTLFQADITAAALNKIALIIRNYERTVTHPDRTTYFRYCANWGSQYFLSLRSSKCPHLLYTAACAWKMLAASNENADPENIMAAMRLSDPMKRTLKAAGEIIGESLKLNMFGGANASTAYTLALTAPQPPPATSNDQWAGFVTS